MMDRPVPASQTLASAVADRLKAQGVKRMFGIPGGGSSLAMMEAAGRAGIDFILTRNETAAALMAAVTGELTGTPGVVLTGIGPGATSAVNGIAYASLEKSPVILFTDGPASSPHQALDQNALFAPITKQQGRLQPDSGVSDFEKTVEIALTPPWGPVQIDLTSGDATTPLGDINAIEPFRFTPHALASESLEIAHAVIKKARKPVILAGLEARHGEAPDALRQLAETLACPVLPTFKALGVLPATHDLYAGIFTGAVAESGLLHEADLIVFYGLDAIEIIPGRWDYDAPILDLCPALATSLPVEATARVSGNLAMIVDALKPALEAKSWTRDEIAKYRTAIAEKFALHGKGHTAQTVTKCAADLAPKGTRLCVDAGAHMFSALACWPALEPFGVLKSDGLSTMGYALPAAIASTLEEPERPVCAVTGDGGLMMCLGELKTALEHGCNITVIVINDALLSLIDIKQQRQQYEGRGVKLPVTDFARTAQALGCAGWRVGEDGDLAEALAQAFQTAGPALLDVVCDPSGYGDQLSRIRG